MGPSKVLTALFLLVQCYKQLSLLKLSLLLWLCYSWRSFKTSDTVTSSGLPSTYSCVVQSGPPFPLCQCSAPAPPPANILPSFRPLRIHCFLPSLHLSYDLLFLAVLLHFVLPLPHSGFFNGMKEIFKPEALNCSTLCHFIR